MFTMQKKIVVEYNKKYQGMKDFTLMTRLLCEVALLPYSRGRFKEDEIESKDHKVRSDWTKYQETWKNSRFRSKLETFDLDWEQLDLDTQKFDPDLELIKKLDLDSDLDSEN